jgi:hypothetical protein
MSRIWGRNASQICHMAGSDGYVPSRNVDDRSTATSININAGNATSNGPRWLSIFNPQYYSEVDRFPLISDELRRGHGKSRARPAHKV